MKDEIINLVKQVTNERNLMLEQMAASAVAKWGIDNVKLCQQADNNYGKMTYWFEPIADKPPASAPVSLVEAVNDFIELIPQIKTINIYDVEQFGLRVNAIKNALAAEVKRQEAVDRVIEDAKKLRDALSEFGNESLAFSRTVINLYVSLDALEGGTR